MSKHFVSLEIAKQLKEAGWDKETREFYKTYYSLKEREVRWKLHNEEKWRKLIDYNDLNCRWYYAPMATELLGELPPYIYIKDVVQAFDFFYEKGISGVYNIGMDSSYSVYDIARILTQYTPTKSQIVINSEKECDNRNSTVSVNKAKIAGWRFTWSMGKAIADYWNILKENENSNRK